LWNSKNSAKLSWGWGGTVGQQVVVFALNASFLNRAPYLQAMCRVSQAWSTMKISLGIMTKFHIDVMSIFLDLILRA
jgi:hypothetical protein